MHLWSGLYLCHPVHALREHELGRGRQVSTLSLVGHMRRLKYSPEQLRDDYYEQVSLRPVAKDAAETTGRKICASFALTATRLHLLTGASAEPRLSSVLQPP